MTFINCRQEEEDKERNMEILINDLNEKVALDCDGTPELVLEEMDPDALLNLLKCLALFPQRNQENDEFVARTLRGIYNDALIRIAQDQYDAEDFLDGDNYND